MNGQSQEMRLLTSHATTEWYTPPAYVELARQVLGGIDLDPASSALPQTWIRAATYWTEAEDGLSRPWYGRVWLNPPYGKRDGRSQTDLWARKAVAEHEAGRVDAAVLLINSTHGYRWFEELVERHPHCLARERIRFLREDGTQGDQAKRGQTFLYLGRDWRRFRQVFAPVGRVLLPAGLEVAG